MQTCSSGISVTWLSLILNVVLGLGKCIVGMWVNSKALVADGLHSLVDLSTDLAALFGLKMAAKPRDDSHPYGHHRFASLSTLFISGVLLFFCAGLIYSALVGLIENQPISPEWPALLAASVSLVVKEWLYHRTRRVAKAEGSRLLMANALHHRADSLSSLLVFVALLAVFLGGERFSFLDKTVAIILGAWMGVEGLRMMLDACNALIDAAPNRAIVNDLREHVLPVDGVQAYHQFRVRRVGDRLEADVHIQVNGNLTVEQGHRIAGEVRQHILEQHPEVVDVLVHVEPATEPHLEAKGIHSDKPH